MKKTSLQKNSLLKGSVLLLISSFRKIFCMVMESLQMCHPERKAKLGVEGSLVAFLFALILVACGGDSANDSGTDTESSSSSDIQAEEIDSSSYEREEKLVIKNKTITGLAQKGPFKSGSTVDIFELDGKTFAQTGKSFTGKVSNDSGAFKISNVSLKSQYALLRVTGNFKSEINGESVHATLTAVTDLSKRENVNVNILTHLEYDRVLYLLGKGMNFTAAKKQAEREVLAAFGIEGKFKNSEDLDVFGDSDADAALVAISKLVLADTNGLNRDEESLSGLLTEISMDLEEDGKITNHSVFPVSCSWNGDGNIGQTLGHAGEDERCSRREWTSTAERIVHNYVVSYNVGKFCTSAIEGKVLEAHYCDYYKNIADCDGGHGHDNKFVCIDGEWWYVGSSLNWCEDYLELEVKTWTKGKDGEIKKGAITGTTYKYDDEKGEWQEISNLDTLLTACTTKRNGKIAKGPVIAPYMLQPSNEIIEGLGVDFLFYYCDKDGWRQATDEEASRYVEKVDPAEVKKGTITDSRDGKTYKTVTIGSQTWMAENLDFDYKVEGKSYGVFYNDSLKKYGRYYNWAAAMDSAGLYSSDGKGCYSVFFARDEEDCTPSYPVHGICPEGWHLPDTTEWRTLFKAMGESAYAMEAVDYKGWPDATDEYGFSALPGGVYGQATLYDEGSAAIFSTSVRYKRWLICAPCGLDVNGNVIANGKGADIQSNYGYQSIRCVKD